MSIRLYVICRKVAKSLNKSKRGMSRADWDYLCLCVLSVLIVMLVLSKGVI